MNLEDYEDGGLKIAARHSDSEVILEWSGYSDFRKPALVFGEYLEGVSKQVNDKELVFDFRNLEHINSSTVATILSFVKRMDARKIRTRLVYNAAVEWQRINHQCMRTIARRLAHITTVDNSVS